MLFKQITVVAIAALAATATAIPVASTAVTDPAVMIMPQDPSMTVITHPAPVRAWAESSEEENTSKWGGGWGGGWGGPLTILC
ncbi:hypothetical protein BG003_006481 [Podila horticola]|nr:hypothetical protein BG003_006481 [Podila horticola]